MKKFLKFAILLLIIPAFVLTSCKDDGDDPVPERQTDTEFQILKDHLVANNLDLNNILDDWIIPATSSTGGPNLNDDLDSYYVIDIRTKNATDFTDGHIPGAVKCAYADVLDTAANCAGKTIVVVCYSGQTAGHAVAALRLSGYKTAKVLKWGMSGWHSGLTASWDGGTASLDHANWTDAPGAIVEHTTEFDDPDITETGDGAAILAARVAALLSGSLRGVAGADVLDAPGLYFINNYWEATDVTDHGNIAGTYRIKPLTLAGEEYIYLDPSKDVVTYCWTGQTSSVITAYLYVLGYNSHSLKFGSNSMIYSSLLSHKWDATTITDLPLE